MSVYDRMYVKGDSFHFLCDLFLSYMSGDD